VRETELTITNMHDVISVSAAAADTVQIYEENELRLS